MKKLVILMMMAAALIISVSGRARAQAQGAQQTPPPQEPPKGKFDKNNMKFDDHDRDATRDWWKENRADPPPGLRAADKLPPDMDAQVKPGFTMADDWRAKTDLHLIPPKLLNKFPHLPADHFIYAFGGHYIVLVDHHTWLIEDVISVD